MSYAKFKDLGENKEMPTPPATGNNNSSIRNSMVRQQQTRPQPPNNEKVEVGVEFDIDIKSLEHLQNILKNKRIVVIDYYSDTCQPCKSMESRYLSIAREFNQHRDIMIVKENISLGIFDKNSIYSVPTIEFYKDGKKVHSINGAKIDEIRAKIEELMSTL